MFSSGPGEEPKDTLLVPPSLQATGSYARASTKRLREDSDPDSDTESEDNDKADMEQMDFQPTTTPYVTETQAIGDENVNLGFGLPQLAPPLSADHEALRSDFEIITIAAMEHLYHRVTEDINKTTALAIKKSTDRLHKQIASMGAQISQLQQQILT
jgi:hypothetical protein